MSEKLHIFLNKRGKKVETRKTTVLHNILILFDSKFQNYVSLWVAYIVMLYIKILPSLLYYIMAIEMLSQGSLSHLLQADTKEYFFVKEFRNWNTRLCYSMLFWFQIARIHVRCIFAPPINSKRTHMYDVHVKRTNHVK